MNDNYQKYLELIKKYPIKASHLNQVMSTQVPTEPTIPLEPIQTSTINGNKKPSLLATIGIVLAGTALVVFVIKKYDEFKERQRVKKKE